MGRRAPEILHYRATELLQFSSGPQLAAHPADAAEFEAQQALHVLPGGSDDTDAGIGVVGPLDGQFANPIAALLGQNQQFRVEEPTVVVDERHEVIGDLAADCLEPALGIRKDVKNMERNRKL